MALMFYPHVEDVRKGTLDERIEVLMEAAERYKAVLLDDVLKGAADAPVVSDSRKRMVPRDMGVAYNWEEIAAVLREIRELPEATRVNKMKKGELLTKLAEVYEVLRTGKMAKLEAVRLALVAEAKALGGGSTQQVA